MRILRSSLTYLAAEGRLTLQIPGSLIEFLLGNPLGIPANPDVEQPVDLPDEWFCYLTYTKLPSTPTYGYLFLTRAGWEANKKEIIEAYRTAARRLNTTMIPEETAAQIWENFVDKHFAEVRQKIENKVKFLKKSVDKLEKLLATA